MFTLLSLNLFPSDWDMRALPIYTVDMFTCHTEMSPEHIIRFLKTEFEHCTNQMPDLV